ncbi:hypothetical protein RBSWK_01794 [Rhodopirellula baltica SWK14]|uniref:Uncharacterized protein n=1 Tax=Rhodopirellula baltica SWK14 TaxID=993516 RepID=L7CKR6_RHOBT|nr:hypothetical protein RBSWK_01794 [Rhodopirellula baltica SWK14]
MQREMRAFIALAVIFVSSYLLTHWKDLRIQRVSFSSDGQAFVLQKLGFVREVDLYHWSPDLGCRTRLDSEDYLDSVRCLPDATAVLSNSHMVCRLWKLQGDEYVPGWKKDFQRDVWRFEGDAVFLPDHQRVAVRIRYYGPGFRENERTMVLLLDSNTGETLEESSLESFNERFGQAAGVEGGRFHFDWGESGHRYVRSEVGVDSIWEDPSAEAGGFPYAIVVRTFNGDFLPRWVLNRNEATEETIGSFQMTAFGESTLWLLVHLLSFGYAVAAYFLMAGTPRLGWGRLVFNWLVVLSLPLFLFVLKGRVAEGNLAGSFHPMDHLPMVGMCFLSGWILVCVLWLVGSSEVWKTRAGVMAAAVYPPLVLAVFPAWLAKHFGWRFCCETLGSYESPSLTGSDLDRPARFQFGVPTFVFTVLWIVTFLSLGLIMPWQVMFGTMVVAGVLLILLGQFLWTRIAMFLLTLHLLLMISIANGIWPVEYFSAEFLIVFVPLTIMPLLIRGCRFRRDGVSRTLSKRWRRSIRHLRAAVAAMVRP